MFSLLFAQERHFNQALHISAHIQERKLPVLGQLDGDVQCRDQHACLPLHVVSGHGSSLLGCDWLRRFRLNWNCVHAIQNDTHLQLQQILENHQSVFREELGELKGFNAQIFVDPTVAPIFCHTRSVPYFMRVKVEEELDRLVQDKVLEPVQVSSWAAPIVPVLKADKTSIRICGDFKLTVNRASKLDQYPLPRVEDLFSTLSGGKTFSKLDMSQAYQQLPLSQESKSHESWFILLQPSTIW